MRHSKLKSKRGCPEEGTEESTTKKKEFQPSCGDELPDSSVISRDVWDRKVQCVVLVCGTERFIDSLVNGSVYRTRMFMHRNNC